MSYEIEQVTEGVRGCGYRKPGGLYMRMYEGSSFNCSRLPIPIVSCTCCGLKIKQSRAPGWIPGSYLLTGKCNSDTGCDGCTFKTEVASREKVLNIWIGGGFYKTPEDFISEAKRMGISRRIAAIPKGFKIGEDWITLSHPKAIVDNVKFEATPGIFYLFRPDAIEYVVKPSDNPARLQALVDKGVKLVQVNNPQDNML